MTQPSPTILVTDATGSVNGHVVFQLLAQGATVRAVDRNPDAAKLPADVEVVCGALADPSSLDATPIGDVSCLLCWPLFFTDAASAVMDAIAVRARRGV